MGNIWYPKLPLTAGRFRMAAKYGMKRNTVRYPGWHTGINAGKTQFLSLLADRRNQLGDEFNHREFMDEFFAAGVIPMSLIRWEMTGLTDEMEKLLQE